MRDKRLPSCAAAMLAALAMAAFQPNSADATEGTPLDVFGKLPSLEDVALSPDGTKLAYVKTADDHRNLLVVQLGKTEILGGVRVGDTAIRDVAGHSRLFVPASGAARCKPTYRMACATSPAKA